MKHGKKPTKNQKILMTEAGLDYTAWLVVKDMTDKMVVVNRETKEQKDLMK